MCGTTSTWRFAGDGEECAQEIEAKQGRQRQRHKSLNTVNGISKTQ